MVLTPRLLVTFGNIVQLGYYAAGFGAFAALTAGALWARELEAPRVAAAAGLAAAVVVVQLVAARRAFGDELDHHDCRRQSSGRRHPGCV